MEAGAKALRKLAAEAAENALLNCSVAQGIVSLKGLRQSGATGQGTGSPGNRPATCFDVFTAATVFSMDSRGSSRASVVRGLQQFGKRPQFGRSRGQTVARQRFKIIVG
jgi:hypothetical protein